MNVITFSFLGWFHFVGQHTVWMNRPRNVEGTLTILILLVSFKPILACA